MRGGYGRSRILRHGAFRAFAVLSDATSSQLPQPSAQDDIEQPATAVDRDGRHGQEGTTEPAADVRVPQRARSAGYEEEICPTCRERPAGDLEPAHDGA